MPARFLPVTEVLVAGKWYTTEKTSLRFDSGTGVYSPSHIAAIGPGDKPMLIPMVKVDAFILDSSIRWDELVAASMES